MLEKCCENATTEEVVKAAFLKTDDEFLKQVQFFRFVLIDVSECDPLEFKIMHYFLNIVFVFFLEK